MCLSLNCKSQPLSPVSYHSLVRSLYAQALYVLISSMLHEYADNYMALPKPLGESLSVYWCLIITSCKKLLTALSEPLCGSNGILSVGLLMVSVLWWAWAIRCVWVIYT